MATQITPFPWPPKAIGIIQRGIALGKSYTEIAEALSIEYNCTVTADAVSSKANRDLRKDPLPWQKSSLALKPNTLSSCNDTENLKTNQIK